MTIETRPQARPIICWLHAANQTASRGRTGRAAFRFISTTAIGAGTAKVFAVYGKGGIGKSTTSSNLSP